MKQTKIGLYIHIPFCKSKCIYCDFVSYSVSNHEQKIDLYLQDLTKEMLLFKDKKISTIFIGGGTPSLLTTKQLDNLFKNLAKNFDLSDLEEFTIEANPESLTTEKIDFLRNNEFIKVDRISLGLQSFDNDILKKIGRHYSIEKFCEKFIELRQSGFENINIDLITSWSFFQPKDTKVSKIFLNDLSKFVKDFSPEHISIYMLTVPEKSKLQKLIAFENLNDIDSDAQIDEYLASIKILKSAGYLHYEISNFAKKNRECKHNLGYWNRQEYIGLGANSCGFLDDIRYKNPASLSDYSNMLNSKKYDFFKETEKIGAKEKFIEEISLGLRLLDKGINLEKLKKDFDFLLDSKFDEKINNFITDGFLRCDTKKNIFLTEKGICISNSIFLEMI
jgi:oxygen-independent coproporphyrinogen-3 oxidase